MWWLLERNSIKNDFTTLSVHCCQHVHVCVCGAKQQLMMGLTCMQSWKTAVISLFSIQTRRRLSMLLHPSFSALPPLPSITAPLSHPHKLHLRSSIHHAWKMEFNVWSGKTLTVSVQTSMNATRTTAAVRSYVWTPKAPGAVRVGGAACWARMDSPAGVWTTCLYCMQIIACISCFHLCCPTQRLQAVTSTVGAAATAAPPCRTPTSATVPEDWSWGRTDAHARVSMWGGVGMLQYLQKENVVIEGFFWRDLIENNRFSNDNWLTERLYSFVKCPCLT